MCSSLLLSKVGKLNGFDWNLKGEEAFDIRPGMPPAVKSSLDILEKRFRYLRSRIIVVPENPATGETTTESFPPPPPFPPASLVLRMLIF